MGISLQGGEMLQYAVGYYKAGIDPGTDTLDFDTRLTSDTEYFGDMFVGRLDFYPLGEFDLAQGDFERSPSPKFGVGVNAFNWENDDDNQSEDEDLGPGSDYDEVQGYGVDGALRWAGISIDLGYNTFTSETVDPTITDGLVQGGEGDFDTYAVKAGYMIPVGADFVEPVAGYTVLDADAVIKTSAFWRASITSSTSTTTSCSSPMRSVRTSSRPRTRLETSTKTRPSPEMTRIGCFSSISTCSK